MFSFGGSESSSTPSSLSSFAGRDEQSIAKSVSTFAEYALIHHDLDPIAHLDLRVLIEVVEHAETLRGMIDARHAVR